VEDVTVSEIAISMSEEEWEWIASITGVRGIASILTTIRT
jgi:hypothetical protein